MSKVFVVEWGDAESCTGEASVDRVFSTYELAKQYVDDLNKYEESSWKFFNIMEYSLDEVYVPILHQCRNCGKQTYIETEECCDDSDLCWLDDIKRTKDE